MILGEGQDINEELIMFEQHRSEYINILLELRHKHPNMPMAELEELAEEEVMNRGPKSRAFYRIQATRKLTGGGNIIKKKLALHKHGMSAQQWVLSYCSSSCSNGSHYFTQ